MDEPEHEQEQHDYKNHRLILTQTHNDAAPVGLVAAPAAAWRAVVAIVPAPAPDEGQVIGVGDNSPAAIADAFRQARRRIDLHNP